MNEQMRTGLMLAEELGMSMVSSGVSEDPHFDYYFKYLFSRIANIWGCAIFWTCSDKLAFSVDS